MKPSLRTYLDQQFPGRELSIQPVGGGCINQTYRLAAGGQQFFLKVNSAERFPSLFEKEKSALEFLRSKRVMRVPEPIHYAIIDGQQLLLLEWINQGERTEKFWQVFGEQLSNLHQITNDQFGFGEDNYMGSLPQSNNWSNDWSDFFIQNRLEPQVKLALDNRRLGNKHILQFHALYNRLRSYFPAERPSLLHGDLWSGNFMCDENSRPVLIDPAIYFGNRNMDLAMTTLFGGFDRRFYDSYDYHFPFSANHRDQWDVCNLYPLLIHLNLFGSSYLGQIEVVLDRWS